MVRILVNLDKHDLLLNIIASLTMSIASSASPIAKNGILKKQMGYEFAIEKYTDGYDKIFMGKFHPPDGFLINSKNNSSLTIECKSDLDEDNEDKLRKQIEFYDSDEFQKVFLTNGEYNEIVIVCNDYCADKIIACIKTIKTNKPLCVWRVEKLKNDDFEVSLVHGKHNDKQLNIKMEKGLTERPPLAQLLLSPNIPQPCLCAELGHRIIQNIASNEISITQFLGSQRACIPNKRLRKALEQLFILIPALGELKLSEDKIIPKPGANLNKIIEKIKILDKLGTRTELFEQALRKRSLKKIINILEKERINIQPGQLSIKKA